MRPSAYQLYPVIALVALAAATLWLERITREAAPRPASESRNIPDFTAEQTRLVSFDEDGRQRYELLADRITNYPQSAVTELDRPRLRYDSDGRELQITARNGEVTEGGEKVFLTGEVRARRQAGPGTPEMTFASETLTVWPEDERAETRDPVVLTQGVSTAHANGLKSDNLFGTLDLLGAVRVHMPRSPRTPR
jgi:lipopolysaccharide export system protein LptC